MSKKDIDIFNGHHAYGGSTSSRWLTCTKSIPMIRKDVLAGKIDLNTTSIHAELGTAAHYAGEQCLIKNIKPKLFLGKKINGFIADADFIDAVTVYVEYVKSLKVKNIKLLVEASFDMTKETNADCGGSADALLIDLKNKKIIVVDYKHGKGYVVEVLNNTQLMMYGVGALLSLSKTDFEIVKEVELTIVQPRAYHVDGAIRTFTIRKRKLMRWFLNTLVPAINTAENGDGVYIPSEAACMWCPRAGYCVANNENALSALQTDFEIDSKLLSPNELTVNEVGEILKNKKRIENYLKSVYFYALKAVDKGERIEGFKIVKSISNRKFKNAERIERILKRKFKNGFYKIPDILTPAQLEKFLISEHSFSKKDAKVFVNKYTERTETGIKLVNENEGGQEIESTLIDDFG